VNVGANRATKRATLITEMKLYFFFFFKVSSYASVKSIRCLKDFASNWDLLHASEYPSNFPAIELFDKSAPFFLSILKMAVSQS